MTRVISVWLPTFQTDRLTRPRAAHAPWREVPFATIASGQGGVRLAAVNAAAQAEGLAPGLTLADARALVPGLRTAEAAPAEDARVLDRLADWCGRFTPWTAEDPLGSEGQGAGLRLDITGCAHLFGGEAALARQVRDRLRALGFTPRLGIADTQGAAWAAARFMAASGESGGAESEDSDAIALLPEGSQRQLLAALPPAALRLPAPALEALRRLGIHDIGALAALPRAPLAGRLGLEVGRRLDQALGRLPEPFSPRRPVAPELVRLSFAEPIGTTEAVTEALDRLLHSLCARLTKEHKGARRLALSLFRVDGSTADITIGTGRPLRDPAHLARLFRDPLNGLDAGFGIEAMTLALTAGEPLSASQEALARARDAEDDGRPAADSPQAARELALLTDRLRGRLGADNVVRLVPRQSHRPDRAVSAAPPLAPLPPAANDSAPPTPPPGRWPAGGPRPVRLFPRPRPARVTVDDRGAPATLALGGGGQHGHGGSGTPGGVIRGAQRLLRHDGPEQIDGEWWHDGAPQDARAYWRVEAEDGQRLWLFHSAGRWFLHGVFP